MRATSVVFALATFASFAAIPACSGNSGDESSDETDISVCNADQDDCSVDPDKKKKDAGVDAGKDSGTDAGKDAGKDSGADAGKDSGTKTDAGTFSTHIRLLEGNISSGNDQSYDPGNGQRILEGLKPDVAMLQEMNFGDNSAAALRSFVDTTFGTSFSVFRETGAQIPNAIISRYPILTSGSWTDPDVSNRTFVYARLDIPGTHELFAVSVHLLTTSAGNRESEAVALTALLQKNVPAGDYITLGGDFNTSSRGEAAITTFGKVFDVAAPYPDDQNGNANTSGNRSKPHDWVLVSPELAKLQVPTTYGTNSRPNGLVFDSRVFTPITAVAPAEASDSASSNMQHMAVVKDFNLAQ